MSVSNRSRIVFPLVSAVALFACQAQAQDHRPGTESGHAAAPVRPGVQAHPGGPGGPVHLGGPGGPMHAGGPGGPVRAGGPGGPVHAGGPGGYARGPVRGPDAHFARGAIVAHNFGGHAYRGRVAWEGGRWRHEIHDGRDGWWWDVGGVWYYYPQQLDGPPTYVSDDYADDVVYADAPDAAYAPPPAPPPPDPGASAIGGAVVGGLLGGLLTGRASGAAAGAVIGGMTGAVAASHPGYYLADGNCYYRYPSGQYVAADPRWCY